MSPSRRYSSLNLKELLDAFASNAPVPGGGSASALAGATGVALLIMVAGMQKAGPRLNRPISPQPWCGSVPCATP